MMGQQITPEQLGQAIADMDDLRARHEGWAKHFEACTTPETCEHCATWREAMNAPTSAQEQRDHAAKYENVVTLLRQFAHEKL
jgi:hypothetical protein